MDIDFCRVQLCNHGHQPELANRLKICALSRVYLCNQVPLGIFSPTVTNRLKHPVSFGFFSVLHPDELLLYFFLVLAADRNGLSFYSYDRICNLLEMPLEQYVEARCALIRQDLIAFDGTLFQVLELPASSPQRPSALELSSSMLKKVAP